MTAITSHLVAGQIGERASPGRQHACHRASGVARRRLALALDTTTQETS
ncbi:hypothetical protein [Halomonas litopenaei]